MQFYPCCSCFQLSKKKWKDKTFAAPVNREEIEHGATALGVDLDMHIQTVLDAMKAEAQTLGLVGVASS
jgi:predicted hydrolase (HD superfamily)